MACCNGHKPAASCVQCDIDQLARNHFFTGKLLVLRDYCDEQNFFMGKDRRHNRYLHGWGTSCGLKVKQHPVDACRNQFVIIEPGMAVDCCGREILLTHEEYFDFRGRLEENWKKTRGENTPFDNNPHTLQVCVRYVECPTEEVPALFDECGCDDTACQPNRILETYDLDVLLDPPDKPKDPIGVRLAWEATIGQSQPVRVALDEPGKQLYILTAGASATLKVAGTAHNNLLPPSRTFANQTGLDLALSLDGKRVYVAVQGAGAADPQILVLDATTAATLAGAPVNTLTVTGGAGGAVRLGVAPDGRLFAVNPAQDNVLVWALDINTAGPPAAAAPATVNVGTNPSALTFGSGNDYAYVANLGSANLTAIKVSDLSTAPIALAAGSTPFALAAYPGADGDNLAVVDNAASRVYLVGWRPDAPAPSPKVVVLGSPVTALAHRPVGAVASAGGTWLYVVERDDATKMGYVQPLQLIRVEQNLPDALAGPLLVGDEPRHAALKGDGARLYVAYEGGGAADQGAVAVIEVTEEPCGDLFKRVLDPCPDCGEGGECIVLATIEDYVFGNKLVEGSPAVGESQIDNLAGRNLLPSTSLITEVIRCMLERGTGVGERGEPGSPGSPGAPGLDIDGAEVVATLPAGSNAVATLVTRPNGDRIIEFQIPRGADGVDGAAGLDVDGAEVTATLPAGSNAAASLVTRPNGDRIIELQIPRGADGGPGQPGPGIDAAQANLVACTQPANATIQLIGTQRTLVLDIPSDCNTNWAHICAINWPHGQTIPQAAVRELLIAFDAKVFRGDIHEESIQLLFGHDEQGQMCWCEVPARIQGVGLNLTPDPGGNGTCVINGVTGGGASQHCNGARIRPAQDIRPGRYRVVVKGDFIRDELLRGVDANHLPEWLPSRRTGDGVEGGTFESWFQVRAD